MRVLSLSDTIVPLIYSPKVRQHFSGVNFVIGCGDLPYYYQEYVISLLDVPLYYVRGNHDKLVESVEGGEKLGPLGGTDVHRRLVNHGGVIIAGVEGSLRYRSGPFQYSQQEMWLNVISLLPDLLLNKIRYKRYMDILITHAPPRGIHDADDLPHRGIDAFRWLVEKCQPAYHIHGHIHIYRPDTITETRVGKTRVINTFGFREIPLEVNGD